MIQPAMTWKRAWNIIRKVQAKEIPPTPGYTRYLESEIKRANRP